MYAAATMSSTSSASGLFTRPMATVTGVRASSSAAARPAGAPKSRRTVANRRPTAATVHSACGISMLRLEKPNARAERPMSQIDSGGLSTVMKLPGSSEPKNHAFQLTLADFTAAA